MSVATVKRAILAFLHTDGTRQVSCHRQTKRAARNWAKWLRTQSFAAGGNLIEEAVQFMQAEASRANAREHAQPRSVAPVVAAPSPVVEAPVVPSQKVDRVTKWREANPELYRERQRAYAKKWRAKQKGK